MAVRYLDLTGPVSPFCLLTVERKAKALLPSDELIITCDRVPAATTQIPQIARAAGLSADAHRDSDGRVTITLSRSSRRECDSGQDS